MHVHSEQLDSTSLSSPISISRFQNKFIAQPPFLRITRCLDPTLESFLVSAPSRRVKSASSMMKFSSKSKFAERAKTEKKWRSLQFGVITALAIILSLPLALMPLLIQRAIPTLRILQVFILNWFNPHTVYLILNLVVLAISLKSGLLFSSSSSSSSFSATKTVIDCSSLFSFSATTITDCPSSSCAKTIKNYSSLPSSSSSAKTVQDCNTTFSSSKIIKDFSSPVSFSASGCEETRQNPQQQASDTSFCNSLNKRSLKKSPLSLRQSSTKLSQMTACETQNKTDAKKQSDGKTLVVFEICADVGMDSSYCLEEEEEETMCFEEAITVPVVSTVEAIGKDELYDKAENFIQNFHRDLERQREESWNRLHGIFARSC